jgi:hypothetical protein
VSPKWRAAIAASNAVAASNRNDRFAHDIAMVITKEPIEVGLPPSLLKLLGWDRARGRRRVLRARQIGHRLGQRYG